KGRAARLLEGPPELLGRFSRLLRNQFDLWQFALLRLRDINATTMAAALSYRTIFALIPVLVLAFLILKSVGVLGDAQNSLRYVMDYAGFRQIYLQDDVPENFAEAWEKWDDLTAAQAAGKANAAAPAEENVGLRIEGIITNAEQQLTLGKLGPIGAALLIWTSLSLMTTTERSLNRIFEAPRSRSLGRRTLLYWSAMTLGPVVLVVTIFAIGQSTDAVIANVPGAGWVMAALDWTVPGLVGIVLLAALYKLMPNTHVGLWPAIGGALFVVPIWMAAKWGFALYVKSLVVKGHLYGTLGLFPLFLLWLYMSWLVFLLGAQLVHTGMNLKRLQLLKSAGRSVPGPWDLLAAAISVARLYQEGAGPALLAGVAEDLRLPPVLVQPLLERLVAAGILCPAGQEPATGYVLNRPIDQTLVLDVLSANRGQGRNTAAYAFSPAVAQSIGAVQGKARDALGGMTLAQALAAKDKA
ncbi:MAG: YihY/virulence factor BrkB family protein, partial [Planctomycetota bacterium]|nr:YihY/virulence factor BrkB family protein [Planctomycetota bacterium]